MRKTNKRMISVLLAIAMILSSVSALAEEAQQNIIKSIVADKKEAELNLSQNSQTETEYPYAFDAEATQKPYDSTPITHTEEIEEELFIDESAYTLKSEPEISLAADTSDAKWTSLFGEQFGDDYLKPYKKGKDGQSISGNTGRVVVQETDLSLPGKNGLDVNIIRKHDNQDYNDSYSYYENWKVNDQGTVVPDYLNITQNKYLYSFKNKSTNENILIAFLTEDDMYTYMYGGCYVKALSTQKLKSKWYSGTGEKVKYYDFEYVLSQMTEDSSAIRLEYNKNIAMRPMQVVHEEGSPMTLESSKMLSNRNYIGNDWRLIMPEVYMRGYSYTHGSSGGRSYYNREYNGAFRDLNGTVYNLTGEDSYVIGGGQPTKYTSTFKSTGNKYLKFENFYQMQSLEPYGIEYNFVVYDSRGLTYYLYDNGMDINGRPSLRHIMSTVAVKDKYDNIIRYQYSDDYTTLTRIIDTYGRNIDINVIEDGRQISYYDDQEGKTKTITYTNTVLPASELDNDSPIKGKEVKRFSVTNEAGETTIYDSRDTEVLSYYINMSNWNVYDHPDPYEAPCESSYHSNIERIIYPTGGETRYKYRTLYPFNKESRIRRGVYAVEEVYDIVDGEQMNRRAYSYSNTREDITTTEITQGADRKTVTEYDDGGKAEIVRVTPINANSPYMNTSYTYNGYHEIYTITENNNGISKTVSYLYNDAYPGSVTSQTDGDMQVTYTYHTMNDALTNIPETINYNKKSGNNFVTDYTVQNTLTADNKNIEYSRTFQNNILKAQTKYEYDAEGNVIKIYVWTQDTNHDGILDETNDEYDILDSEYTVTPEKTLTVTNAVSVITDADGQNADNVSEAYGRNIYGSPISKTDTYSNKTKVQYDNINRPVQYTYPNGAEQSVEYNTAQSYTIVTDEKGVKTKNQYDDLNRLISKEKLDNNQWKPIANQEYDAAGQVTKVTSYSAEGASTANNYTYDALGRVIKNIVKKNDSYTLYTEDYSYGTVTVNKEKLAYSEKKTTASDHSATATQKTYTDNQGRTVKEEVSDGTNTYTKTYTYDYMKRPLTKTDSRGNTTTYEYDYAGNVTKTTDAWDYFTTSVYDLAGRKISDTDQLSNTTVYTYDELDRVIKQVSPFDDSNDSTVKTYYDGNSNVVKQMVQNNAPGEAQSFKTTEYKYDSMNNVIAAIGENGDVDSVIQYEYNSSNLMTKMITGLTEYTANPTGGARTLYSYNSLGQLEKTTDPLGMETSYSYDYLNNQTGATDRNGSSTHITYTPFGMGTMTIQNGEKSERSEYIYNNLGQITLKKLYDGINEKDRVSYTYDAFGRTTSEIENGFTKEYGYDENSNLTSFKLKQGSTVKNDITYQYNELNRINVLKTDGHTFSYAYDARGNLDTMISMDGANRYYTYNKAGLPVNVDNSLAGNMGKEYNYTYYLDGNRKSDSEVNGVSKSYQYDGLGHLVNETQSNGDRSDSYSYVYDAYGNRTKLTVNGGESYTTDYSYDLNNRLLSQKKTTADAEEITSYRYDNNGNQLFYQKVTYTQSGGYDIDFSKNSKDFGSYQYNLAGQVTDINNSKGVVHYDYNANGLRKGKTVDGKTTGFVWNGQNMAAETSNGNISNVYTYDMTGILSVKDGGNNLSTYMKNAHGDVTGIVDKNDKLTKSYQYDAFGNEIGINDADTNPFRYCGEYYDNETGDIYLRARYYSSGTGRFISEDPVKDGTNWYSYCAGNPVMLIDSLGLFDYNTRLSYSQEYNEDVVALQNELVYLGYMKRPADGDWGYFGPQTLAAVNAYKNDRGLYNEGDCAGVVGITTWQSFQLPYRTQNDIDAGVQIVLVGHTQYYDVTIPIENAVKNAEHDFYSNGWNVQWFMSQVAAGNAWDIKLQGVWEETIGTTYPGRHDRKVIFQGNFTTPEALGNITYGYLGAASGYYKSVLLIGGDYAAGGVWGVLKNVDSYEDKVNIEYGYNWYTNQSPRPGPAPR